MVTTFYPPYHFGGDGVFVHRLSNELAQRGHTVDVVHSRSAYDLLGGQAPTHTTENHPRVTVHTLNNKAGMFSPLLTQQTGFPMLKAQALRRILEGNPFDVIHFHNISLVGGPGVLAYGEAIKLYTMHEYWLVCPMHILFKDNQEACTEPACMRCTLKHHRPPQLWRYTSLLKKAVNHVDAFLAPSQFTAEMHIRRGLNIPTVHLPLFIPDPASQPSRDPGAVPNEGRPYFLFVGRLEKLKGLQDVILAFARYTAADLVIVGDGTYRRELEQLAAGNKRVHFLGAQPYKELGRFYAHALALLTPSLCYETFGLVIMEAFAQRTPVIARRIGAFTELVEQSGGGRLFETEDDLLQIMHAFQMNPMLRDHLAEQGYMHYRNHGTVDHHLDQYLALIATLQEQRTMPSISV